jgi:beta-xylosidase
LLFAGTCRNPVLPADFSDLDCIRVGSDYYAISSTFQDSAGVVILHSKDLVNWTFCGHAMPDVDWFHEEYSSQAAASPNTHSNQP